MPSEFTPPPPSPPPPPLIPILPAPWALRAELHIFLAPQARNPPPSPFAAANPNSAPEILQGLPAGAYHPLEAVHPAALAGRQWAGGAGKVVLARYEDSPAGAYSELMYVSDFRSAGGAREAARITNVYVSTEAGVWNGRRNHSFPMHLARFDYTRTPDGRTLLRVSHPADAPAPLTAERPFFVARLTPSRIPLLPVAAALLPSSLSRIPLVVGNAESTPWLVSTPVFKGHWGVAYIEEVPEAEDGVEGMGDGVGYPRVRPWSAGVRFEGILEDPKPTVMESEED
ncbi:hypothetical protein FA95DRAFT_1605856 [Auriscalpium vulgare]|uniref:Uncharacterized protein n=1 Tax=Auriscalpium vulgare TaxID=40419 RepID=A0ACB8RU99_9AGAM|nr:hypothetical protein FA95DRAFT_1605856 [Auriscalpium vulgare]